MPVSHSALTNRQSTIIMKTFWALIDGLERKMRGLGAFCLMAMVILTCTDIIGRVFSRPIFGTEELISFLMVIVLGTALPLSHKEKIHVGVEIVFRLFSAPIRVALTLITTTVSLALMVIIAVMMFDYAKAIRDAGQVSMNLQFPEYTIIFALAVCFMIMNLLILRDIIVLSRIKENILRFENDIGAS
jgi:TRAP-type transport system small permease protein